jgi:Rieske Fe-S protein
MTEPQPAYSTPTEPQSRRSILKWAIHGMGALFAAILGIPALAYLIDARNRPAREKGFRTVDGIKLGELKIGEPVQGTIRDVRQDAWTLHPNDVIGRVWVIKKREWTGKPDPKANPAELVVFTTICPHLGCSINHVAPGFTCPCHNAKFLLDGVRVEAPGYNNPAPRGMDTLEWLAAEQPDLLQVKYENFRQGEHHKVPKV